MIELITDMPDVSYGFVRCIDNPDLYDFNINGVVVRSHITLDEVMSEINGVYDKESTNERN